MASPTVAFVLVFIVELRSASCESDERFGVKSSREDTPTAAASVKPLRGTGTRELA